MNIVLATAAVIVLAGVSQTSYAAGPAHPVENLLGSVTKVTLLVAPVVGKLNVSPLLSNPLMATSKLGSLPGLEGLDGISLKSALLLPTVEGVLVSLPSALGNGVGMAGKAAP